MRNAMEPESRKAPRAEVETRSGHFRIYFTGFRVKPSEGPAAPAGPSAWNAPGREDERAYFQADISWINLAESDSPQTSVLTAMIIGDVRGLRKTPTGDADGPAPSGGPKWLPLSLGTYALVSGANAISIGNFGILPVAPEKPSQNGFREPALRICSPSAGNVNPLSGSGPRRWPRGEGRSCLVDLPLLKPTRSKAIFLTYHSAIALSRLDQGFGRGVFPIECGSHGESGPEYILYFGIDKL
jgi:hypothetical protein